MPDRPRWYRRHPVLAVLAGVLAVLLLAALVLAGRALLVVLSIGPRAEYWQEQAALPGSTVYVALGDSLSQGIGSSSPETSFVGVLADDLQNDSDEQVRVVNLSVTGDTAAELIEDQLPAFTALQGELAAAGDDLALVTLVIGANDAGDTAPEKFRGQLRTILAAMPPGTYVADVPDFNGGATRAPAAELSAIVREEVAGFPDLVLVPLEEATGNHDHFFDYAGDFFHPSDQGYERYIDVFRATIGRG